MSDKTRSLLTAVHPACNIGRRRLLSSTRQNAADALHPQRSGSVIEALRPARGAAVVWSGRFEDAPHGLALLPGDALGVDP
jgi:hypothetical protein